MSYGGIVGSYTVFPTVKPAKAPKAKKGRRGRGTGELELDAPKVTKARLGGSGDGLSRVLSSVGSAAVRNVIPRSGLRRTRARAQAGRAAGRAASTFAGRAGAILRSPISKVATASFSGTLAAVAAAAVLGYASATFVINKIKDRRERIDAQKFELAKAYRKARAAAALKMKRPLRPDELEVLAAHFKREVAKI